MCVLKTDETLCFEEGVILNFDITNVDLAGVFQHDFRLIPNQMTQF